MARQALIVGLGKFGLSLARALKEYDVEVLAVDRRSELVQEAADIVDQALCLDSTDEDALARTAPERRDVVVCAIGDESRDASILTTALLKQMGAKQLIARASDPLHARILRLVGADEVVDPETAFGRRLAPQLAVEGVLGEYPLGEGLVVAELRTPDALVGRSLRELELPKRRRVTVVALRRTGESQLIPDPDTPLATGDVLVVVSTHEALRDFGKAKD